MLGCWAGAEAYVRAPQHLLFLRVLSDLSLPHQIFIAKADIWNGEIHSAAWFPSEKVSAPPAPAEGEGLRGWMQNRPRPLCVVRPRPVASSPLNRAALRRSPGCCNLLSARPDYRLLHIVWRRLRDGRGGRRRGEWEGWRRLRFVATRAPLPFY